MRVYGMCMCIGTYRCMCMCVCVRACAQIYGQTKFPGLLLNNVVALREILSTLGCTEAEWARMARLDMWIHSDRVEEYQTLKVKEEDEEQGFSLESVVPCVPSLHMNKVKFSTLSVLLSIMSTVLASGSLNFVFLLIRTGSNPISLMMWLCRRTHKPQHPMWSQRMHNYGGKSRPHSSSHWEAAQPTTKLPTGI